MPKRSLQVKITGKDGEQREIPRGAIVSVSFDDEQDGGNTSCTVETSVDLTGLPTVVNGDTVSVFIRHEGNRELRYYGSIVRRAFSQEDGQSLTLTCEGESSAVGRIMLDRQFLEPGPPDIAALWLLMAEEVRLKRPDLYIQAATTGLFKSGYEAFMVKFGDASRAMIEAAGNRVGWSVRRTVAPPYTPILSLDRKARPADPITGGRTIALPARIASSSDGEADATDIRNILYLRGGVSPNPNGVPNANFRLIEFAGDTFRNLLNNPSFDNLSGGSVDHWSLLSGASKKSGGLTEGPTHSGDYMIELDNAGETAVQARDDVDQYLIPGHYFRVQVWARLERGSGTGKLRIDAYWRDVSTAEIGGATYTYTITDASWQLYGFLVKCPDSGLAKGFRVSFVADTPSIMVDDSNFFDASLVVPRFMELRLFGTATQEGTNYVQTTIRHPYRSAYAPEFAIRSSDADGNDAHFGLRNDLDGSGETVFFPVVGNSSVRLMVDLISPRTPNGGVYKSGKFFLEIKFYKPDNTQTGLSVRNVIAATSGFSVWTQKAFTWTAPTDATQAIIWLTFRGGPAYSGGELTALDIDSSENGLSRIIVGGFCVRLAGSQPAEVPSRYVGNPALPGIQYEWIPDGPYQTKIACTDVMSVGSAEYLSIDTYGEHPTYEQQDSITTQEEAVFFAQAIFYAYATEIPNGSISLEGDTRQFLACEGIRLRGKRGRALSSLLVPLKRVSVAFDGDFKTTLSWGIERDNPYDLLTSLMEKTQKIGGSGAGSGFYGSSGPSSGGIIGGGGGGGSTVTYWGTSPRTSTDPTLHDDYAPVAGPHVIASERANWNTAFTDVTDARDSAYLSTSFADIDARFENVEALASTGGGSPLARADFVYTTASIAVLAEEQGTIAIAKKYDLLQIEVSDACRVRLYVLGAAQTDDASRDYSVPAFPGIGLIAEFLFTQAMITAGTTSINITPVAEGYNADTVVTDLTYISVQNLTTGTASIVVTLTCIPEEL